MCDIKKETPCENFIFLIHEVQFNWLDTLDGGCLVVELGRFLQIAMGSASELQYQLLLAHDLKYLKDNDYEQLDNGVTEVKQMLTALIKTLKADR